MRPFVRGEAEAWEIASEAMARGWLRFGDRQDWQLVWPWLYRVARNLVLRRGRLRREVATLDADEIGTMAAAPGEAYSSAQLRERLWIRLSDKDRATMAMMERGDDAAAIARQRGGTVRSAHQSMARVREQLRGARCEE